MFENASNFSDIIDQIADEKNIDRQDVLDTIKAALAAAYRKDYGDQDQLVEADFDETTLQTKLYDVKNIIEAFEDDDENKRKRGEITLEEAREQFPDADHEVGDTIRTEIQPPEGYGRIAAQTAKQVIIQRIREAERTTIFDRFKDKEGEVINGSVQRVEGDNVFVDINGATAILYPREQLKREHYAVGQRVKVYIVEVRMGSRGPEIIISRTHPEMVRRLFELEVPEIHTGIVEIKSVAREAGNRSKIAVWTDQEGVDPVGSCVGQRGTRVQTIIAELAGEKIDIIEWDEDPTVFIANALAPASVKRIELNKEENEAKAIVDEDQLSLAIGKEGQNVRLAARLAGWKIDILKDESTPADSDAESEASEQTESDETTEEAPETTETKEALEAGDTKESSDNE